MPPKKKAGKAKGKKKKGKKKEGNDDLNMDDLYQRTVQEVDSLKERLAERQTYARRTRAAEEVMKDKMIEAKAMVQEEKLNKREITYDMTRQYKSMQAQLEGKVDFLEAQVKRLQSTLDQTVGELEKVTGERDRIHIEREQEVEGLHTKLQMMEKSYEVIIQEAFDSLATKTEAARQKWDAESRAMEKGAVRVLSEFRKDIKQ